MKYFDTENMRPNWDAIIEDMPYVFSCGIDVRGTVWMGLGFDGSGHIYGEDFGAVDGYWGEELAFESPLKDIVVLLSPCDSIRMRTIKMVEANNKLEGYIRKFGGWLETIYDLLTKHEHISDHDLLDIVRTRIEECDSEDDIQFLSDLIADNRIAVDRLELIKKQVKE